MRRKYRDCQRADGNCALCSLVSYGRDCHGENISKLEWMRMSHEMTQKEVADAAGVDTRKIQRLESGEIKMENLALGTAIRLADAFEVDVRDLL